MAESKGLSSNNLRMQGATNKKDEFGVPPGLHRMGVYDKNGKRYSNKTDVGSEQMQNEIEKESNDKKTFHALSATPGMELENKLRDSMKESSSKYSVGIHYKGKEYLVEITPLNKEILPSAVGGKRFRKTRKQSKVSE